MREYGGRIGEERGRTHVRTKIIVRRASMVNKKGLSMIR